MVGKSRWSEQSERWADDWPRLMAPEEVEVAHAVTAYFMKPHVERRRSVRLLRMVSRSRISIQRGGPGSGHWGHKGRPGEVGGSVPSVGPRIIIEAKVQASDASLYDLDDSTERASTRWSHHEPNPKVRLVYDPRKGFVPSDQAWSAMSDEEKAASWKATVSQVLAEELGVDPDLASAVLKQWAATSCDESYSALVLQKVASRLFGGPMQDWASDLLDSQQEARDELLRELEAGGTAGGTDEEVDLMKAMRYVEGAASPFVWNVQTVTERLLAERVKKDLVQPPRSPEELEAMVTEMRGGRTEEQFLADMMRATYAATQRLLTEWGVDGVIVYRGVGLFFGDTSALEGNAEPLGGNPLQSWTLDPRTAQSFAVEGPAPPGAVREAGVVYAAYVPRERIFSLPFTGPGCLRESEVVIIGGSGEKTVAWYKRVEPGWPDDVEEEEYEKNEP